MSDETPTAEKRGLWGTIARVTALVTLVGFLALLGYGLLAEAPDRTIDDALASAEAVQAPEFELDVLQRGRPPASLEDVVERATADGRVALSELRGTPVVLNYWASWCDPCRVEAPVLERGWRQAGPDGVLFVGLDMQDLTSEAREFLREFDVSYLNVRDPGKTTSRSYGVTGLPETFFISAQGEVVHHVVGAITDEQLSRGTAAAVAGRPLPANEGGAQRPTR